MSAAAGPPPNNRPLPSGEHSSWSDSSDSFADTCSEESSADKESEHKKEDENMWEDAEEEEETEDDDEDEDEDDDESDYHSQFGDADVYMDDNYSPEEVNAFWQEDEEDDDGENVSLQDLFMRNMRNIMPMWEDVAPRKVHARLEAIFELGHYSETEWRGEDETLRELMAGKVQLPTFRAAQARLDQGAVVNAALKLALNEAAKFTKALERWGEKPFPYQGLPSHLAMSRQSIASTLSDGHLTNLHDPAMVYDHVLRMLGPDLISGELSQAQHAVNKDRGPERLACGQAFRPGDMMYRCTDCALDETCVQYEKCFKASKHEGHDTHFSIASTQCAGTCDCGDPEAWHGDIACPHHPLAAPLMLPSIEEERKRVELAEKDPATNKRHKMILDMMNGLVATLSVFAEYPPLPEKTTIANHFKKLNIPGDKLCVAILLNDEKHNFEEVCTAFDAYLPHLKKHKKMVTGFASEIDQSGWMAIGCRKASEWQTKLNLTKPFLDRGLEMQFVPLELHFLRWMLALRWTSVLAKSHMDHLRVQDWVDVFEHPQRVIVLEQLFFISHHCPKEIRRHIRQVFADICTSLPGKYLIAKLLYQNYFSLLYWRSKDREPALCMNTLTVQCFGTPTIATRLMDNGNLQDMIFHWTDFMRSTLKMKSADRHRYTDVLNVIAQDLGYILESSTNRDVLDSDDFLYFIAANCALIQDHRLPERQVDRHVEYEDPKYMHELHVARAFNFLLKAVAPKLLHSYFAPHVLDTMFDQGMLDKLHPETLFGNYMEFDRPLVEDYFRCPSLWNAIQWVLVTGFQNTWSMEVLLKDEVPDIFENLKENEAKNHLFSHSVSAIRWLSEMSTGLWVRNGTGLELLASAYRVGFGGIDCFYRDLDFLMHAFASMGPLEWLNNVFLTFHIKHYIATFATTVMNPMQMMRGVLPEDTADLFDLRDRRTEESWLTLAKDFFMLLLQLGNTKMTANLVRAQFTKPLEEKEDMEAIRQHLLEHELLSVLFCGPIPYSELLRELGENASPKLEAMLHKHADYRPPRTHTDFGTYVLKKESMHLYSPYVLPYWLHVTDSRNRSEKYMAEQIKAAFGPKAWDEFEYYPYYIFEPHVLPLFAEDGLWVFLHHMVNQWLSYIACCPGKMEHHLVVDTFFYFLHCIAASLMANASDKHNKNANLFINIFMDFEYDKGYSPDLPVAKQIKLRHAKDSIFVSTLISLLLLITKQKGRERLLRQFRATLKIFRELIHKVFPDDRELLRVTNKVMRPTLLGEEDEKSRASALSAADDAKKKKAMAQARQKAAMEAMRKQSEQFIKNHEAEEQAHVTKAQEEADKEKKKDAKEEEGDICIYCSESIFPMPETDWGEHYKHFCQKNAYPSEPSGYLAFAQESLNLRSRAQSVEEQDMENNRAGFAPMVERKPFFIMNKPIYSPMVKTCGHQMHLACYKRFSKGSYVDQMSLRALGKGTLWCPLCKAAVNTFLPNLPLIFSPTSDLDDTAATKKLVPDLLANKAAFSDDVAMPNWQAMRLPMSHLEELKEAHAAHHFTSPLSASQKAWQTAIMDFTNAMMPLNSRNQGIPKDYVAASAVSHYHLSTLFNIEWRTRSDPSGAYSCITRLEKLAMRAMLGCVKFLEACPGYQENADKYGRFCVYDSEIPLFEVYSVLLYAHHRWSPKVYASLMPSLGHSIINLVTRHTDENGRLRFSPKRIRQEIATLNLAFLRILAVDFELLTGREMDGLYINEDVEHQLAIFGEFLGFSKTWFNGYWEGILRYSPQYRALAAADKKSKAKREDYLGEEEDEPRTLQIECENEECPHRLRGQRKVLWPYAVDLVPLPEKYEDLLSTMANVHCANCQTVPRPAILCLLCGRIACESSMCCQNVSGQPEIFVHNDAQHGGLCLYLNVHQCSIMIGYRQSLMKSTAPYLDAHGEPDPKLTRGKPLFLNQARLNHLRKLVFQNEIPSHIARGISEEVTHQNEHHHHH